MTSEPAAPPGPHLVYARQQRDWYARQAPQARLGDQFRDLLTLALVAAASGAAALNAHVGVTAVIGVAIVVATGIRAVFRWQETQHWQDRRNAVAPSAEISGP